MAWSEKVVGNGIERDPVRDNGFLNGSQPSPSNSGSPVSVSPVQKRFEGKDAISYANILRSRNKFAEALDLYESVLERESGNVEAHIGKGICLQMQNIPKLAINSFAEAIRLDPQNACALTYCGIVYKDEGCLAEAAESYQKALRADPSYKPAAECLAIVLTDLGTSLKLAGSVQEGIQKYHEALKIDPHYAPAYYNLGVVYSEMLQFDLALNCYEKAALERPMYAEAYCNMGVIYKNRGELESAIACYERCLAVSPNFEIAKNNMAIALTDLGTKVKLEGDINQGVGYYKKALYYNWHYADAMYNLGVAYGEMLKFDMAIVFYELAFHFNPQCAEACNNLGVIYKDRDNLDKAVECYQLALSIKPNFSQSLNNLGVVYTVQGKMDIAASLIEKAIIANPTYAEAYNNLGVLYRDAGNISLAIDAYEQCLKIDPDSRNAGQNRLLAMNYINEGHDDKLFEAHRDWGKRFMRLYPQYTLWENAKDLERPLVVGYVSPDFFTHSVSYFIEAPLVHHDYANYKVVVYSAVVKADAKTIRFKEKVIKKGGIWRDIYGIDEKKVAIMVREDKIDILVELTGHTANNKLGMMACRPAPVQVTWIGYPNTTGLPAIDYRITDSLADSPHTKQEHVEELVRLPECFLCYTPSPEAGPVSPAPALSNGFITFGSFNNLAKITPKVLQVWARILCAVPNSRLVVKCKPFCCDSVRERFLSTLEQLGLEPLRVDLLPLILLNHDHMQAYSLMDISLDTFPYAGTTTTCESLYMGVPCVTMAGSVHAHNVGVSLLSKVGLGHLVAKSEDEYVQLALQLASDTTALSNLQIQIHGSSVQGRILHGNSPSELIEHFTETIGRPPELPEWIISGAVVGIQGGTETVRHTWDGLRTYNVPISAFWLQDWVGQRETLIGSQLWWNWEVDTERYWGWQQLVQDLSVQHIKVMTYCNPCLAPIHEKPNRRRNLFEEAKSLDILVKDKQGQPYMVPNTAFDVGMLDLTHPNTASWFKQILQEMVDDGVRGWMADFGEGLPVDATLYSGEDPISAHNRYPELWAQINSEFVEEWKRNRAGKVKEDPKEALVFFMRAGFRNSPKWGMLFWEGDQMVSWQANDGIKSAVTGLLSSGLSGYAFNHSDIGGYCAVNLPFIRYRRSEELLLRWMELNAFTTVFRTHEGNKPSCNSQFYSNHHTLSQFARFAQVYRAWKFYRIQLVKEAAQKGLPVCRHLFLHYPEDDHVHSLIYQQFLVGTEILVVPVLDKGKKNVKVYFPVGERCDWQHIWTGKLFREQGCEASVEAPIGYPAVFVKTGSTIGETFIKNLRDFNIV